MKSPTWILSVLLLAGCSQEMSDHGRLRPLASEDAARTPVEGTVARGNLRDDELLYTGKVGGRLADLFPFEITRRDLDRGRERYTIYCTPCHDHLGTGQGIVVQRGFRQSASFHEDRLRKAPAGHLFDVMTNGFGAMAGYATEIPAEDRWRIAAYVRALQRSTRP